MAMLYVINGPSGGHSYALKGKAISIGRASENDIQIKDLSVSRNHAKILKKDDKFFIQDLGSRNGILINGNAISPGEEIEVYEGITATIGDVLIGFGSREQTMDGIWTQHSINVPVSEPMENPYGDRRFADRENLETIYEVSTILMQSLEINEILQEIINALFACLKRIDSAAILLIDEESGGLNEIIAMSKDGKNIKMNYSRTVVDQVMSEGKAVIMSDIRHEDGDSLSDSMKIMKIKSIMCVPLISKSKPRGVIYVHSVNTPNGFRKDDLLLLTSLSSPAVLAIENGTLYSKHILSEEALRKSEEKYRLLVNNANDAIFIVQDGMIKFANPSTFVLSEYSDRELASLPFVDLFHPEDRHLPAERHRKMLDGQQSSGTYSLRAQTKNGRELQVQLNDVMITWKKKPATLNFMRDITEQKNLEARLRQTHKMEAIGTMAGGVAHDFNNLFMGIQGNISLMLLDIEYGHPHYEKLKNIEQYIRNGAELNRQLLGFARSGKYEIEPIDINELIKKQNRIFGRAKKEITVRGKYEEGLWAVEADRGQMEQILLNLYVNAADAMPNGGELFVQTENIKLDESQTESFPFNVNPGKYIKISITDTGVGMDKATQQKIFDPFFTTKELGRGTGLGLASVYGIIKNHGGLIEVCSEKNKETTFYLYLPTSEKKATIRQKKLPEGIKGTETILLVDDEEMIIDVTQNILQSLGYKTMLARGGKEAIETYINNRNKIDLVILDMIMPGLEGGHVFDRLKEIDPDIKVLLSSGYSIDGRATKILQRGCDGFIQKPFNLKQLSSKIRDIMGNRKETNL